MRVPRWLSLPEFSADPRGAAARGCGWAVWCLPDGIAGVVLWGQANVTGMRDFHAALDAALDGRAAPGAVIVDARGLHRLDEGVLVPMARHLSARREALTARISGVLVVRPARPVIGALLAGMLPLANLDVPVRLVDDLGMVERDLGRRVLASQLLRLADEAAAETPLLARLTALVERRLPDPDLDPIARELGVSPRTLQRRLRAQRTTFRREVSEARLRVAERLLRETDDKIVVIAMKCGFPSSQHFATAFRRARRHAPSAYRELLRCADRVHE